MQTDAATLNSKLPDFSSYGPYRTTVGVQEETSKVNVTLRTRALVFAQFDRSRIFLMHFRQKLNFAAACIIRAAPAATTLPKVELPMLPSTADGPKKLAWLKTLKASIRK